MILVTFSFTDSLRMSESIGMMFAFDLHVHMQTDLTNIQKVE